MAQVQLDESLLEDLGITGLNMEEKNSLLAEIFRGLNLRMGIRIAEAVGPDKLAELTELTDAGKDAEANQWIIDNVPNYQDIANEELEKYKTEVKKTSQSILSPNDNTPDGSATSIDS